MTNRGNKNGTTIFWPENDKNGGMTHFGQMVKDGWVFGLIPDTEDCTGWDSGQMQNLYDKICTEWGKYANLPSLLPEGLKQRHAKIYQDAIKYAKANGWDPEMGDDY